MSNGMPMFWQHPIVGQNLPGDEGGAARRHQRFGLFKIYSQSFRQLHTQNGR